MNREKKALLEHAGRCRRTAEEVGHIEAARRLQAMAHDYEVRAAGLEDDEDRQQRKDRR